MNFWHWGVHSGCCCSSGHHCIVAVGGSVIVPIVSIPLIVIPWSWSWLLLCHPGPHCPIVVLSLSYPQRLGVLSLWSSPVICCSLLSTLQAGAHSSVAIPIVLLHCCRIVIVISTLNPTL